MASSGRALEDTFTPVKAARLIVTITLRASGIGTDWGADRYFKTFCEQDGTTVYGDQQTAGNAQNSYTARGIFNVVGGLPVKAGLFAGVSGAASIELRDISYSCEINYF